jgi:hypothetical protein
MKEKPILFSASMVNAILNGMKCQTRRIVKPQPMESDGQTYGGKIFGPEMYEPAAYDKHGEMVPGPEIFGIYTEDGDWGIKCPYGQPGDRMWVRETFSGPWCMEAQDGIAAAPPSKWGKSSRIWYWADGEPDAGDWTRPRPSIHMPRWASRIDLEITGVRVERLQDISEADAKAEGITSDSVIVGANCNGGRHSEEHAERFFYDGCDEEGFESAVDAYRGLWESLAGPGSWDANPWCWVVEFRRVNP